MGEYLHTVIVSVHDDEIVNSYHKCINDILMYIYIYL